MKLHEAFHNVRIIFHLGERDNFVDASNPPLSSARSDSDYTGRCGNPIVMKDLSCLDLNVEREWERCYVNRARPVWG